MKRTLARWLARLAVVGVVLAATPVIAAGAAISPYVRDDLALDRIVRAVALDWRDFGRSRAETRLQYELDHQEIGLQVRDQNCTLTEDQGSRIVECSWMAALAVPGMEAPVALPFDSRAVIAADGDLQ
jgi:hypothetical protein